MENKQVEKVEKRSFWKDERGDIGVKQIAITVGVIVLVASVVSYFKSGETIGGWISDVWEYIFKDIIQGLFK